MTKEETKQYKFNLVKYVYGQIYKGYLQSDKSNIFKVHHIKAQTWYYVLNKMKEKGKIEDFAIGNTEETALDVAIQGFDDSDLWYPNYVKAIAENLEKEEVA